MNSSEISRSRHHWLLRATPLLAALLDTWTPLSFAISTLHTAIVPAVRAVLQQQQESGPQAASNPPAHGGLSPSDVLILTGKRDGTRIQCLGLTLIFHYCVFTLSDHKRKRFCLDETSSQKKSKAIRSVSPPQSRRLKFDIRIFLAFRTFLVHHKMARGHLV